MMIGTCFFFARPSCSRSSASEPRTTWLRLNEAPDVIKMQSHTSSAIVPGHPEALGALYRAAQLTTTKTVLAGVPQLLESREDAAAQHFSIMSRLYKILPGGISKKVMQL